MTDRELLELAAKAAGLEWYGFYGDDEAECKYLDIGPNDVEPWNPLTNDGDALRLAIKLCLWEAIRNALARCVASDAVDIYAATRRAIVRAAAAIGKDMK